MAIRIAVTDTFGGDANYSWIKRGRLEVKGKTPSDLSMVRRAKAWAGWSGLRCRVTSYDDELEVRPYGMCQVMFIRWMDEGEME
jgi:hypothetical protein